MKLQYVLFVFCYRESNIRRSQNINHALLTAHSHKHILQEPVDGGFSNFVPNLGRSILLTNQHIPYDNNYQFTNEHQNYERYSHYETYNPYCTYGMYDYTYSKNHDTNYKTQMNGHVNTASSQSLDYPEEYDRIQHAKRNIKDHDTSYKTHMNGHVNTASSHSVEYPNKYDTIQNEKININVNNTNHKPHMNGHDTRASSQYSDYAREYDRIDNEDEPTWDIVTPHYLNNAFYI